MSRTSIMLWFGIGLVVRLAIAPLGAHPYDFATLTRWATAIHANGLLAAYTASDANYPPLALAILGASRAVYGLLNPGAASGALWMILLKLPAILADLGIAWAVKPQAIGNQQSAISVRLRWLAVLFNPALIYLSAWWGQYESVYALPTLLSLLVVRDGRAFRAGLWLGVGLMVKLQAAAVAPVMAVALVAVAQGQPIYTRLIRFSLGFAVPLAIFFGPFIVMQQGEFVLLRLVSLVVGPGWPTLNALNLWYLVTSGVGNWRYNAPLTMPDTTPILFGLSPRFIGVVLVAIWSLIIICVLFIWLRNRQQREVFRAAALLYLGSFLLPTQSHERYAFAALVVLAPVLGNLGQQSPALSGNQSAGQDGPKRPLHGAVWYLAITVLHTLNLLWAAPFSAVLDGWLAGNQFLGLILSGLFCLVSFAMLILFVLPSVRRAIGIRL